MNILEKVGFAVDIEKENALLEELSIVIPYFVNKGLKDNMTIADSEADAKNPLLHRSIWKVVKALQELTESEDTLFIARETPEGGRARSLTFGIANGKVRCLDSATIKVGSV